MATNSKLVGRTRSYPTPLKWIMSLFSKPQVIPTPQPKRSRKMASKFAPEFIAELTALAPVNFEKATAFAEAKEVNVKSVIAACTRNGIPYERKARVSKTGAPVVSKEDLVANIATNLGVAEEALAGLDKATKVALETLFKATC